MHFSIMPHANIVELGAARGELHLHTVLSIAVRNCTPRVRASALGPIPVGTDGVASNPLVRSVTNHSSGGSHGTYRARRRLAHAGLVVAEGRAAAAACAAAPAGLSPCAHPRPPGDGRHPAGAAHRQERSTAC